MASYAVAISRVERPGAISCKRGATMTNDTVNSGSQDATRGADRRKHRRTTLKLGVRFLLANGTEHSGTVTDISLGGMAIASEARPETGSIVIAYVEGFGRLEGMVSRLNPKSFAVQLTLSAIKREKLEERLSMNKKIAPHEGRRHEREATRRRNGRRSVNKSSSAKCGAALCAIMILASPSSSRTCRRRAAVSQNS